MKVLMFSMDKTLLGVNESGGDAIKRHRSYGEFCDELNIIVFCKREYQKQQLADNIFVWPTNSVFKFNYFCDAYKIAKNIYKDSVFNLVIGDLFTALPAWFLKIKYKTKFLMHFHGDFWQNKSALEKKLHNYFILLLSKFLVHRADAVRVVSSGIKNKLIKSGVEKNKIYVIPTPSDLSKFLTFDQARVYELKQKFQTDFLPDGPAGSQGLQTDFSQGQEETSSKEGLKTSSKEGLKLKILLFVGRLEPVKNLNWFLNVFMEVKNKYNNIKLLIIGEGKEKENLKLKVKDLNLEDTVKFLGTVEYNDLTNYYHLADVFVLPSLSESFGKVLVEAGASGIPCIASATTGAKEIIQDNKTGFLAPINNKNNFINKILKLLEDEKLANKIGENAREFVLENFNGDVQTKKIIKLWQSLVF